MRETILILGGTREAAALAAELVAAHPDWRVITALAGRTREPLPLAGEMRTGGFGGVEGLVAYLRAEDVTRLIDATHPFARQISANARKAAAATGVPLDVRMREPWTREVEDNWIEVSNLTEARDAIPPNARVLLALGAQHIAVFASRADVHFVVRMVDQPAELLPLPNHELVIGRPSTAAAEEAKLLRSRAISHIVCRNSGGEGAYAKIEAARMAGIPVIMVARPKI